MQELAKGLNLIGEAGQRESAQSIVQRQIDEHARELAGWQWIGLAIVNRKPTEAEEAALWSILCRARRERY